MTAFKLNVGDTVYITNSRMGWSNKTFMVMDWGFNTDGNGITIFCSVRLTNRYFLNSISHVFYLGHTFFNSGVEVRLKIQGATNDYQITNDVLFGTDGWAKQDSSTGTFSTHPDVTDVIHLVSVFMKQSDGFDHPNAQDTFTIGDISAGWSWSPPHSPDLELTQTISNESLKIQNTLGGHTLSNAGWNYQPKWGRRPAWSKGTIQDTSSILDSFDVFPSGRRSWNLKFSYVSDEKLFPPSSHDGYGIFSSTSAGTSVKDNFVSKLVHGTNNFQLPFIFQPNQEKEEYAICRINSDSVSFNQVANNVYDISLDIVETW